MIKKKKSRIVGKITIKDYLKAVKKADRDIQLENSVGWISTNKIHKSKKSYSRTNNKKNYLED